jgi:hypothetical protein
MSPGDIIERCGHRWRVRGIHLGGLGVESVVEIENVSHNPAWTGMWETHQLMFVPEVLLRDEPG